MLFLCELSVIELVVNERTEVELIEVNKLIVELLDLKEYVEEGVGGGVEQGVGVVDNLIQGRPVSGRPF